MEHSEPYLRGFLAGLNLTRRPLPNLRLASPPSCRHCKSPAGKLVPVRYRAYGNSGREAWYCTSASCQSLPKTSSSSTQQQQHQDKSNKSKVPSSSTTTHQPITTERFIAWNDAIGIDARNPPCLCDGRPASRQDKYTRDEALRGNGFWTCATGACRYHSSHIDGEHDAVGCFKPFLLEGHGTTETSGQEASEPTSSDPLVHIIVGNGLAESIPVSKFWSWVDSQRRPAQGNQQQQQQQQQDCYVVEMEIDLR